jgi:hypothetical protein
MMTKDGDGSMPGSMAVTIRGGGRWFAGADTDTGGWG